MTREIEASFEIVEFLRTVAAARLIRVKKSESIYLQGADSDSIYYIASGKVRLSVASRTGKEATIALLSDADFFGEDCIQNGAIRGESATAWNDAGVLKIDKVLMVTALNENSELSLYFIDHLLAKNARYQSDLVDLFFNFSEKRLARVLLELSDAQDAGAPVHVIPKVSHETLAEMVGTTRSRISFFMSRFRRMGIIENDRELTVRRTLLLAFLQSAPNKSEEQAAPLVSLELGQ